MQCSTSAPAKWWATIMLRICACRGLPQHVSLNMCLPGFTPAPAMTCLRPAPPRVCLSMFKLNAGVCPGRADHDQYWVRKYQKWMRMNSILSEWQTQDCDKEPEWKLIQVHHGFNLSILSCRAQMNTLNFGLACKICNVLEPFQDCALESHTDAS